MFVFWFLVVCGCIIIGLGLSAVFGDKILNKANKVKSIYVKEEEEEENGNHE